MGKNTRVVFYTETEKERKVFKLTKHPARKPPYRTDLDDSI